MKLLCRCCSCYGDRRYLISLAFSDGGNFIASR
jgi:hypothetical protein